MGKIKKKENIVFVLGAGFSKFAGGPLISEFTNKKTFKWLGKRLNKKEKNRLDYLEEYIDDRVKAGYCKEDIESILNHVAVGKFLFMESQTGVKRGSYSAEKIFQDLQWYIIKLIKEKIKKEIPPEYEKFVKMIYENKATVISFNYDLVLESVFEKLGYQYEYGPKKTKKSSILILKPHGSINWAYCKKCQFFDLENYLADRILSNKEKCLQCKTKSLISLIIPPIMFKGTFYEKTDRGGDLIQWLWNLSNSALASADKIFFIGFAMRETDSYALELFKFSSSMNNNAKYFVVSPNTSVLGNYYRALVKRESDVKFLRMKFEEYIRQLH